MNLSDLKAWIVGQPTFARGIHPPTCKSSTARAPIESLPTPGTVLIPLHQHAGAPATLAVKSRAKVEIGDLVGRPAEFGISVGVHASIHGQVGTLTAVTLPNGRRSAAVEIVPIDADAQSHGSAPFQRLLGGEWNMQRPSQYWREDIIQAVYNAGVVGLGGAAFPTHIKLAAAIDRQVHTLLVNGCECEPYLTADERLMIEAPTPIVAGVRLMLRATGASRAVIAIEDNKPQAAASMRAAVAMHDAIEVVVCQTKYPMGGERQLIPSLFGFAVPTGGFPMDVGILVVNVATAAAVAGAVLRGHPLTHRVVTIAGSGIRKPKNLFVPIGTSVAALLEHCGGLTDSARRVIVGGPMMGFTITDLGIPVTKATGGITVLVDRDVADSEQLACIRCGQCLDVCPLGLAPTRIAHAVKQGELQLAIDQDLTACCECGCCAYVCPSRIPLVQYIRSVKQSRLRAITQGSVI